MGGVHRLTVTFRGMAGERRRLVFVRDPASPWWTRREEVFCGERWCSRSTEQVDAPDLTVETRSEPSFAGP